MSKVLVIDPDKKPQNPVHPAQARQLLRDSKAAIYRKFPFTIILKELRPDVSVHPLRIKIDPGAKTTGIAVVNDSTGEVVLAIELQHRGFQIRDALTSRRQLRRSRRNRTTRYRQPRFDNRKRPEGWLPPSLISRVCNIETWVNRLHNFAPISNISQELVRFDTQLMQNPDVQGKEYQQGTLAGYETREYLLEKFDRKCAYCDKKDVPLQIEHIHSRAKGGSNRISNLTLSCEKCNIKKGTQDIKDFLKKEPTRLKKIEQQCKKPLADTAAVNATRFKLLEVLKSTLIPVETGSGGLTKFNRSQRELDKTHWIDAAVVGTSTPEKLIIKNVKPLIVVAVGHGTRQMCRTDKYGFPNRYVPREKKHFGFQTGDIVKAVVKTGKKVGEYIGKVAIRSSGSFNISTKNGLVQGISYKYCKRIHAKDGYSYAV
ncbi:RNA-guided endonuclease IscB [Iningainema tapete]|uniref:HNH endonuclease n=1 Tax=Iningainema tapete BLCC-T55 TaxID=2748662 RepID=A0A8J6XZ99_9CYAN|nr:RNA-guided endonuclease IscB [Iningainema tapete]MBD2775933.1 HNH endonuclease [Iningainema tapete BLCC-T55]